MPALPEVQDKKPYPITELPCKIENLDYRRLCRLVEDPSYDRFSKVKWVILFVEKNEAMIDQVIQLANQKLRGGSAGKAFCGQLRQLKEGEIDIDTLKCKWPVCFRWGTQDN